MWSSSVSSLKMTHEQHSLTVDDQTTVQKCGRKSKMQQDECLDVSNKPFYIIISAGKN